MSSYPIYKIHTYDNNFCLNDIVIQKNILHRLVIKYVPVHANYNSQFYLSKDKLCDILSKSKELLQYLNDTNTMKDKLVLVELNKKNNMLINFVDHKQNLIQFNNKQLKYFVHNNQFYFKAKDAANILEYVNTAQTIRKLIDDSDKFSISNLLLNDHTGGCYAGAPP